MGTSTEKSVWASGGAYEPYVGRWSRLVAREFVEWLAIPPAAWWLDVGCGTGALTETMLGRASPTQVHGIDPSEGYLALAREQVRDPRARFDVGDARHLSVESARYGAVVSALVSISFWTFLRKWRRWCAWSALVASWRDTSGIMRERWN
jgi:trans-aconitate methyltransferase